MERLCVLLSLLVLWEAAEASPIIFPGQLEHAEGDVCRTPSGGAGTCLRSCGHSSSLGEAARCGVKDSAFLVCCTKTFNIKLVALRDVSPPGVTFQCGNNTKVASFLFDEVRRPETLTPPPIVREIEVIRPGRSIPGGFQIVTPQTETSFTSPPFAESVGGVNAKKNAWPWMALLGERDGQGIRWFCGGVLINEQWVLTALHCFFHNTAEVVRLGEHNSNDDMDGADHQDFGVAETVFQPDFTFGEAYHDLALLKLDARVTIQAFISPVCLPWGAESDKNITGQETTLTGWGDTQFGGFPSPILQEVKVTVFPSAQCDRSYSNLSHYADNWPQGIGRETVCAGDINGGRDACQGDSGGPLVSQAANGYFVLAGIVSQGFGCGHKDYPGLYVNVRHPPYLAWIKMVAFTTP